MRFENHDREFKQEYTEDIKKAVIAFANSKGGQLIIGMRDDGSVRGLEDADGTMQKVCNVIRDAIRPDVTLFTHCSIELMEDKPVVVLCVQRGTARPYYLAGKGIRPEGVYVRQGSSSVPAIEAAILKMIRETGGDSYEQSRSLNQQLSFEKTGAFFKSRGLDFGDTQKKTLHLISADDTYSNLGLLLSDQCQHSIKLAIFEGSQKSIFKDRLELSGSLLYQLEEAYAAIERYNRVRAEYRGLDRVDIRDYPPQALREALLNAIVHRDYAYSAPTLIRLFDDHLEFVTVGGLPQGIAYEDILLGISVLRNQHLANVFFRLRLIEAYGTGLMKIHQSYQACAIKPRIEVSANAFKISLPNVNAQEEQPGISGPVSPALPPAANNRDGIVRQMLRQRGSIVRKDIEKTLQVSQATAILILRELQDSGLIVKEGTGNQTRYRLADRA